MAAPTADRIRAFVALALEPALAAEIGKIQQSLDLRGGAVRWVHTEQLHLTLQFLGHVASDRLSDLTAALRRACSRTTPFQLTLEGVGCFPNVRNPRIIWIGIQGDLATLGSLQERIAQETTPFGDHRDPRAFQPHLTIGRVKAFGSEARKVGQAIEWAAVDELGVWTIQNVLFVRSELASEGSHYTTLDSVPLDR